jgi:flavin-dependent dehydrogenase
VLGQARSEPILRNYLLAQFGVAVELATELVHFDQDEDGVSCHIVKHSVDGYKVEEDARVEYVVGADGAKGRRESSTCLHRCSNYAIGMVRKALGLTYEGQSSEQHAVIGDVRVQGLGPLVSLLFSWSYLWLNISTNASSPGS